LRLRLLFCELCVNELLDSGFTNDNLVDDLKIIDSDLAVKVSVCACGEGLVTGEILVVESECVIHCSSSALAINVEELIEINYNCVASSCFNVLSLCILSNDINISNGEFSLNCCRIDYHECELNEVFAALDGNITVCVSSEGNYACICIVIELVCIGELATDVLSVKELNNRLVVSYGVVNTPNGEVEGISRNNYFDSSAYAVGTLTGVDVVLYAVKSRSGSLLLVTTVLTYLKLVAFVYISLCDIGLSLVAMLGIGGRIEFILNNLSVRTTFVLAVVDEVTEVNTSSFYINAVGSICMLAVEKFEGLAANYAITAALNNVSADLLEEVALVIDMTVGVGRVSINVLITAEHAFVVLVEIEEAIYRAEFAIIDVTFLSIVVKKEDHELTVEHVLEHRKHIANDVLVAIIIFFVMSASLEDLTASATDGVTCKTGLAASSGILGYNYFVVTESLKRRSESGIYSERHAVRVCIVGGANSTLIVLNVTAIKAGGINSGIVFDIALGIEDSIFLFDFYLITLIIFIPELTARADLVCDVTGLIKSFAGIGIKLGNAITGSLVIYASVSGIVSESGDSNVDTSATIRAEEGLVTVLGASGILVNSDLAGEEGGSTIGGEPIFMSRLIAGCVISIDMLTVNFHCIFYGIKYGGKGSLESVYAAVCNVAAIPALLPLVNVATIVFTVTVGNLLGYFVVVTGCFKNKCLFCSAILALSFYIAIFKAGGSFNFNDIIEYYFLTVNNIGCCSSGSGNYLVVAMTGSVGLLGIGDPTACGTIFDLKSLCFADSGLDDIFFLICVVREIYVLIINSRQNVRCSLLAVYRDGNRCAAAINFSVMMSSNTVCNLIALADASRFNLYGMLNVTQSRMIFTLLNDNGLAAVCTAPYLEAEGGTRSLILSDLSEIAVNNVLVSVLLATNAALNVTIAYFNGVIIVAGLGEFVAGGRKDEVLKTFACFVYSLKTCVFVSLIYALIVSLAKVALIGILVTGHGTSGLYSLIDKNVIALMLEDNYNLLCVATSLNGTGILSKAVDAFDVLVAAKSGLVKNSGRTVAPSVHACLNYLDVTASGALIGLLNSTAITGLGIKNVVMLLNGMLYSLFAADRAYYMLNANYSLRAALGFYIFFCLFRIRNPVMVTAGALYKVVKILCITGQTLINSVTPFFTVCINCFNSGSCTVICSVCFVSSGTLQFVSRKDRRRNERQNHDRCQENRKKLLHVFFLSKK